jgi:SPP1 gp7 family putative phage head morphogenesis protein
LVNEKGGSVDAITEVRHDAITEADIRLIAGQAIPLQLARAMEPLIGEIVIDFGNAELGSLGMSASFAVIDARVVGYLTEMGAVRIPMINDTTRREISKTLAEGVLRGEGIESLTARVRTTFRGISKSRAALIARTEVGTAASFARNASIQDAADAGIVDKRRWIATIDNRTRHNHLQLNGQVQPVGKPFKIPFTSKTAMYPGGFSDVKENANCRCVVVAIVAPATSDRIDETNITPEDEKIRAKVEREMVRWDNKLEKALKKAFDVQEKSVMSMLIAKDRPTAP